VESHLDLIMMKKVVLVLTDSIIVRTTRIPFRRSLSGTSGVWQSLSILVLAIDVRCLLVVLVVTNIKELKSYTGRVTFRVVSLLFSYRINNRLGICSNT
jgi:hypothetical protein